MAELSFRQELQCIRETEHLRYIIAMIVWFKHWKQDQGWGDTNSTCSFQVGAATTVNIETRVLSVITQVNMSQGESQVLWVLTTLQYLAEVGPKSPPPGHVAHSVQSMMRPLKQLEISFQPHAVLGYGTSVQSSTSIETDVSCADISSLPSSICSAGDMLQPDDQSKDYRSAMGGMTRFSQLDWNGREVSKTWKENQMLEKNKVEQIKSEIKAKCQTINRVERKQ